MANNTFGSQDLYVKRTEISNLIDNTITLTNFASGGSIGTAPTTVDVASVILINQTTAGQTLSLPNPTVTTLNRSIQISNIGSTNFTLLSTTIAPNGGIIALWNGTSWSAIGSSAGATSVVVAGGKTFTVNNTLTLAGTDGTTMTFPTTSATVARSDAANTFTGVQTFSSTPVFSSHVTMEGVTSTSATGTGAIVFATSPTLVTPVLGVATATSLNSMTISTSTGTFTLANSKTFVVNNGITLTGTDSTTMTFPTTTATIARTDAAQTFTGTNTFSHIIVEGVTSTGATGTGSIVFATSPTLTTPTLGVATVTSINKITLTQPATGSTLTIVDGKTVTMNNTMTFAGTDAQTYTFPSTSATIARTDAANTFTGHQTIEGVTSTGATGTGNFVFATSPTLTTPVIGVASGTSLALTGGLTTTSTTSAGVGYATGAGGTVTQATNKSTAVTLNKLTGQVTMNNAALGNTTAVLFTLTNNTIAATDVVHVSIASGTASAYLVGVTATAGGSCQICVYNVSGGSLSEALVLNYVVLKGVSS